VHPLRILIATDDVERSRAKWRYQGQERPPFAIKPEAHQLSVWDFPRPPRIENFDGHHLRVEFGGQIIARTSQGRRVLETAGAPTYYFPPEGIISKAIERTGNSFHCEWKGMSDEVSVATTKQAGWVLEAVYQEFRELYGWYAFYPHTLNCFIDDEQVGPQPGGYYGGWVTRDLVGPIKGEPGTENW
jgi:uncharacterized protein (DUF427 family)